jgi:hypothetical protein
MKRFAFTAIFVLAGLFMVACPQYILNPKDPQTIEHLQQLRQAYTEDIAAAASTEDNLVAPEDLGPEVEYPGELDWGLIDAALGNFDAFIAYEESKVNPEEEGEEGDE